MTTTDDAVATAARAIEPAGALVHPLASPSARDPSVAGGKASRLAELVSAGAPVPDGFVVTAAAGLAIASAGAVPDDVARAVRRELARLGEGPLAVRSSALAEDLADASFAGLYETYLDVRGEAEVLSAIARCVASARADRVLAYHGRAGAKDGMAVLVQRMVAADAAGVCFTADPVSGARDIALVSATPGTGERLVSGEVSGEEWRVIGAGAERVRDRGVIDAERAIAIVDLARRLEREAGAPQDVEWAIAGGEVFVLQARPMTALPDGVSWEAPGPGGWIRNFRLGEWIGDPVTPSFESWLLTGIEERLHDYFEEVYAVKTPRPLHAIVNGWYFYGGINIPRGIDALVLLLRLPLVLLRVLTRFREAMSMIPPLAHLGFDWATDRWRTSTLPAYRREVAEAEASVDEAPIEALPAMIDRLARAAGDQMGAIVGVAGYAAKAELPLAKFWKENLASLEGSWLEIVRSGECAAPAAHEVVGLDWIHPTVGELDHAPPAPSVETTARVAAERDALVLGARAALAERPEALQRFERLAREARRAHAVREEQARVFTLAWPVLRRAILRIGEHLARARALTTADGVFFLSRAEIERAIRGEGREGLAARASERRATWQWQRRLSAPLLLGELPRHMKDAFAQLDAILDAGGAPAPNELRGMPGSPGRVTGRVRVVRSVVDLDRLEPGEILVAPLTTPAWTLAFTRAAAVVTDTGSVASHASVVAREYGLPAVVATGDATTRLRDGQTVTVDGARAVVRIDVDRA